MSLKHAFKFIAIFAIAALSCDINEPDWDRSIGSVSVLEMYLRQDKWVELEANRDPNKFYTGKVYFEGDDDKAEIAAYNYKGNVSVIPNYKFDLGNPDINDNNMYELKTKLNPEYLFEVSLAAYLYGIANILNSDFEYVFLKINDDDKGLYLLTEAENKNAFKKNDIELYELFHISENVTFDYGIGQTDKIRNIYSSTGESGKKSIKELLQVIDTISAENIKQLDDYIDIKEYLRFKAVSTALGYDTNENYYLYKESANSPFQIMPGEYGFSEIADKHKRLFDNDKLIALLMENDKYFDYYMHYLNELLNTFVNENIIAGITRNIKQRIEAAYNASPYNIYGSGGLNSAVARFEAKILERKELLLKLMN